MIRLYHDQKQHRTLHHKRVPPTCIPNRVCKCTNTTTDRNSRRTIQHSIVHINRYIRCTVLHIIPYNRTQFHKKSPSPVRHSKRHHNVPACGNNASHEGRKGKMQPSPHPNKDQRNIDSTSTTNSNRQCRSYNHY